MGSAKLQSPMATEDDQAFDKAWPSSIQPTEHSPMSVRFWDHGVPKANTLGRYDLRPNNTILSELST